MPDLELRLDHEGRAVAQMQIRRPPKLSRSFEANE
jgi:hypothetical protein